MLFPKNDKRGVCMNEILMQWKAQNKLSEDGDFIYGNYNKVGFSVNYEDGGFVFVMTLEADDDSAFRTLQNKMSSQSALRNVQVGKVESYLALFTDNASSPNDLSRIVDFTARNYSECGFYVPTVCSSCGAAATRLKFENGIVRPVCADCKAGIKKMPEPEQDDNNYFGSLKDDSYESEEYVIGKRRDDINSFYGEQNDNDDSFGGEDWSKHDDFEVADSNEYSHVLEDDDFDYGTSGMSKGHVLTGILGAVIGAAAGVLPYYLIYTFFDMPVAALCLVSGVLSVLFYVLFRGRKSVGFGMAFSLIFSVIVATGAVVYIQNLISIAGGNGSVFSDITGLLSNTEFLIHELMAIVGVTLGAFVCKGALNNYCE